MEGYICINGNKTLLTPEQIKELGFCEKPVPVQGLAFARDSLRDGSFLERFKLGDVIEDFGYHFEIIGYFHDRAEEDKERPTITVMSKELLPAHRMHSGACPNGWVDSELRHWLNHDVLESLPDALRELIQPTVRESVDYKGRKHTSTDMLFLPTESELFGSAIYSPAECGSRYPVFSTSESRVRVDEDGDTRWYWTSSAYSGGATYFVNVSGNGCAHSGNASGAVRAPICFQIS